MISDIETTAFGDSTEHRVNQILKQTNTRFKVSDVTNGRKRKTSTERVALPVNQTPEPMQWTNYMHKEEWNRHFGNNAEIRKQYPTSTFSCSVHDVISMNESRSIEKAVERNKVANSYFRKQAMMDYMHRTATNI